jgi:hypothetical protein
MKQRVDGLSRREFIEQSIANAGLCIAGVALGQSACAEQAPSRGSNPNPFPYEIGQLAHIDESLLKYTQIALLTGIGPEPRRIAIGAGDLVHIATRDGVEVLDGLGTRRGAIKLSSPARCVTVAEDGTVYVGLRTHIEVFDAKGQAVATWEPPTAKTWLTGLCVGSNDLFAADSANRVILRYDRSGKLLGRIGEKSKERNVPGFIVPSPYLDVKLGLDNLLRINNPGRHRVDVFTVEGDLELSWGKPGTAIEGFCGCCNPIGLALLRDGRCVTCEKGIPRVKVFSTQHALEAVVAGPELFTENGRTGQLSDRSDGTLGGLDAAVDSQGRIYVLDLVSRQVRVMAARG